MQLKILHFIFLMFQFVCILVIHSQTCIKSEENEKVQVRRYKSEGHVLWSNITMNLHSTPVSNTISKNFLEMMTHKFFKEIKLALQDIIKNISHIPKQIIDRTESSISNIKNRVHNMIKYIVTKHTSEIHAMKQEAGHSASQNAICFITLKHQIDLHMNAIYSSNNRTIANAELEAVKLTVDTNNLIDSLENSWNKFPYHFNDIDGVRKEFEGIVNQANSIMYRADSFFTLTLPAMSKSIISNIDDHLREMDLAVRNTLNCIQSLKNVEVI